jgi:hypothetical protein
VRVHRLTCRVIFHAHSGHIRSRDRWHDARHTQRVPLESGGAATANGVDVRCCALSRVVSSVHACSMRLRDALCVISEVTIDKLRARGADVLAVLAGYGMCCCVRQCAMCVLMRHVCGDCWSQQAGLFNLSTSKVMKYTQYIDDKDKSGCACCCVHSLSVVCRRVYALAHSQLTVGRQLSSDLSSLAGVGWSTGVSAALCMCRVWCCTSNVAVTRHVLTHVPRTRVTLAST